MPPETTSEATLRIGELARRTGKTNRTLHFYEELGLLAPMSRTKGGFRIYAEHTVLRVRWIERLKELGFSLQEIAAFLSDLKAEDSGPASMTRLRDFYEAKVFETRAAMRRLAVLEEDLQHSLSYLDGCRTCDLLTHRFTCGDCHEEPHEGVAVPEMVAAVHDLN